MRSPLLREGGVCESLLWRGDKRRDKTIVRYDLGCLLLVEKWVERTDRNPARNKDPDDPESVLANWIYNMRRAYREIQNGSSTGVRGLTSERMRRLSDHPRWRWASLLKSDKPKK